MDSLRVKRLQCSIPTTSEAYLTKEVYVITMTMNDENVIFETSCQDVANTHEIDKSMQRSLDYSFNKWHSWFVCLFPK